MDKPSVDYSDAIGKALSGAMASIFPSNWGGDDKFAMKPATFEPGTAKLTAEGKAVTDEIGSAFANKSGINLRACGRAAREDLLAMRGVTEAELQAADPSPDEPAETAQADTAQQAEKPPVTPPSDEEIKSLLALADRRSAAIREYLGESHGIAAERVPQCRTAYSVEDGKPPRAEFLF